MTGRTTGPRRRAVIIGAAALLGAAGCSSPHPAVPARPTLTPDQLGAGRAVLAARSLLGGLATVTPSSATMTSLLAEVMADHRAHLVALGAASPTAAAGSAPSSGTPSSGTPSSLGPDTRGVDTAPSPAWSAATAVVAERSAAAQALTDVETTTPGTAGLLARIAAALAVHADLLAAVARLPAPGDLAPATAAGPAGSSRPATPTAASTASPTGPAGPSTGLAGVTSPPPSTDSTPVTVGPGSPTTASASVPRLDSASGAALSALLSGEHAAVFAYGLVTARINASRQGAARALWDSHRTRRDALEQQLADGSVSPPSSAPAYDVGPLPVTPDQVTALAARVEEGLAAVALDAVVTTVGQIRAEAAADLVLAARRAATWRGTPQALPG